VKNVLYLRSPINTPLPAVLLVLLLPQVLTVSQGSAAAAAKTKKAGPKVKSNEPAVSIELETELIAEHALQASRMLPGGLAVLGLYLFAPESGYSTASSQLCSTLAAIAADSSSSSAASTSGETAATAAAITADVTGVSAPAAVAAAAGAQELLLLHVDSSSRKFTMRSCQVSSAATAASTLKPSELKFGPSLSSLVCLRCSHSFDFSFPASSSQEQLQQLLQQAVAAESARVITAVAALDGKVPVSSSQPLTELLPARAGAGAAEATRVELLCLPHSTTALRALNAAAGKAGSSSSSSSLLGSCRLHGTVEALAYVHKRDSVGKALQDLKNDVINSLAARLQLLEDDAAAAADEVKQEAAAAAGSSTGAAGAAAGKAAHPLLLAAGAGKCCRVGLARRVLLPWCSLGLQVRTVDKCIGYASGVCKVLAGAYCCSKFKHYQVQG
jgi:hypothetical protein